MIDHVTIFVSDLNRSKAFYEAAFAPLGHKIAFGEAGVFWAFGVGRGCLFEIAQARQNTPLAHVHVALRVADRAQVRAFHEAALAAGGSDNGAPGLRPHYTENYYAAFVHDPDGHNIEAMFDIWPVQS